MSVLVMAAAGLTFLGSSVMLIKQRTSPAAAAATGTWSPRLHEGQLSGSAPEHEVRPAAASADLEMLQARLASLNDRFERVVRQVQLRRGGRR